MKKVLVSLLISVSIISTFALGYSSSRSGDVGCYIGIFKEGVPASMDELRDLEMELGKNFAIIMWYQDWSEPFPVKKCDKIRRHKSIPHIVWEPWLWSDRNKIKLDNIINGEWDKYIRSWAKDIKKWGDPIFIRWGHEFNIEAYPWGIEKNGKNPEKYIKAFRHVKNIFINEGASNAKFIWCPMDDSWPKEDWNEIDKAYPGDKYVDWIGIDGYNWGTVHDWSKWKTFKELFRDVSRDLWRKHPTKPIMIAEFASATQGGDKAKWIRGITDDLKKMPYIKAIQWFDVQKEADWRIDSSARSLSAFGQMINDPYYAESYSNTDILIRPILGIEKKIISAYYTDTPLSVDSNISKWITMSPAEISMKEQVQEGSSLWKGPMDLSGKIYFKWDRENLYLTALINDDRPFINSKETKDIWNGDAVEIVLGLDTNSDPNRSSMNKTDIQIGFGAGNNRGNLPTICNWKVCETPEGAQISVKQASDRKGYTIQAILPWRSLSNFTPFEGNRIGFDWALDDSDSVDREKQMVWNGDFKSYNDPGVWGQLEFIK